MRETNVSLHSFQARPFSTAMGPHPHSKVTCEFMLSSKSEEARWWILIANESFPKATDGLNMKTYPLTVFSKYGDYNSEWRPEIIRTDFVCVKMWTTRKKVDKCNQITIAPWSNRKPKCDASYPWRLLLVCTINVSVPYYSRICWYWDPAFHSSSSTHYD